MRVRRDEGVELHWESQGEGPTVVLASYFSFHPSVFDPITAELRRDHRVVRYDDRGAGRSTRTGPYDLESAADDLEAVAEAAGGPTVLIGIADGASRTVRVGARRPDLVTAVISLGTAPIGREEYREAEALAGSETVVDALIRQMETDYRGALRTVVTSTNPQMDEAELRERVRVQAEYCSQEGAVERLRAYAADAPLETALALGDRLWVLTAEPLAGGWFPAGAEMIRITREALPEAHAVLLDDGMVSRPDLTAAIVREITAPVRATAAAP